MIKKTVTVISWRQGIAIVKCVIDTDCINCYIKPSFINNFFKKKLSKAQYTLEVPSTLPLIKGQKVEISINESILLRCSLLVYMLPILGFAAMAIFFQKISIFTDIAKVCMSISGGWIGFFCANYLINQIINKNKNKLIILTNTIPLVRGKK